MEYIIRYKNPSQQYIPIEAKLNTRKKNEVILQFPTWRPGRYEMGNFVKNVHSFIVQNENGKRIPFKKLNKDSWTVDTTAAKEIRISYKYFAAELNAGSTFIDDLQLYVNPVNCLVYVKDLQGLPCRVTVDIPEKFQIACGATHENNIISCKSYHELVDSPFIASATLQHKTYTSFGKTFHLWFQGSVELDWNKLIGDFEKFTKLQIEKFSSRSGKYIGFPTEDYHFLFQILPIKAYHGVEHTTSTVIALGPSVEIMNKLYDELLGVSSHELYHVWNIKTIRPAEMMPYDYSTENHSNLGYVAEGVTTYLGDLFLALSGVKDFSWYKLEFEKLLQRHFSNFGRFNYSVAQSSWDTWLDGYVAGAPRRKVSIYNEGALLAFVTDIKIRVGSNNKASLHDVMKELYREFGMQEKGYTEADYKRICEFYAQTDLTVFFDQYIHGVYPYESILAEALEHIGFEIITSPNPKFDQRVIGVSTQVKADKTTEVIQIWPGSGAELGGVMIGDIILSINDRPINGNISEVVKDLVDDSLYLSVNRMGRKVDLICPNTNRNHYPVYCIKKSKNTANLHKRIFKKWIGTNWEDIPE